MGTQITMNLKEIFKPSYSLVIYSMHLSSEWPKIQLLYVTLSEMKVKTQLANIGS